MWDIKTRTQFYMMDYFALLNEPRRPWLETSSLKEKFLALSAEVHPDRFHNTSESDKEQATQRYTDLNAAYNCLREPKSRLQHLLELETGSRPKEVQQIPPETMELFMEVAQLCRQVDGFVAQRAKVSAPMLKVELFERAQEWTESLNCLQVKIAAKRDQLNLRLEQLNTFWEKAPLAAMEQNAAGLQELEQLWRDFSYVARWSSQIQERLVELSL